VTEPPALFADVLREPRAEARLRREKLAEARGLSPRATQRSETGRYPA
jgi:DNA-binding XRE family transcriptional regulator